MVCLLSARVAVGIEPVRWYIRTLATIVPAITKGCIYKLLHLFFNSIPLFSCAPKARGGQELPPLDFFSGTEGCGVWMTGGHARMPHLFKNWPYSLYDRFKMGVAQGYR